LKRGVVEVASLAELVLEKLNLGFGWVEAVFVGEAHLLSLLALDRLRTTAALTEPTVPA